MHTRINIGAKRLRIDKTERDQLTHNMVKKHSKYDWKYIKKGKNAMKRISVFVIMILLCAEILAGVHVRAEDNDILESARILESMDVIRNYSDKWQNSDYITRRDALEIVYIIKSYGRQFSVNPIYREYDELKTIKEENPGYKKYIDVEPGSYDDYLVSSGESVCVFNGKVSEGIFYADLDSNTTYNEAITFIGYLFDEPPSGNTMEQYYKKAIERKIIDADEPHQKHSLKLEEYISPDDFFEMVYRAINIPSSEISCWGSEMDENYYIRFSKIYRKEAEFENIID